MNADLVAQRAIDRLVEAGPAGLTETERTVAAAWLVDAGVENSGFESYYHGHGGDLALFAPAALRAIGANELAGVVEDANATFGHDGPPTDRAERRRRLRAVMGNAKSTFTQLERRYDASTEDIDELLERYLIAARKRYDKSVSRYFETSTFASRQNTNASPNPVSHIQGSVGDSD